MDDRLSLDTAALRRSFNQAANSFDAAAVVHREVRQRALSRLQLLRHQPTVILDLGAGTGHASRWLSEHYPRAQIIAMDSAFAMLQASHRQLGTWRKLLRRGAAHIGGDAAALPLRDASVDWVFSNLMLPWCATPEVVFAEIRRVLKPGGMVSFTTFGPDTLCELRAAWRGVDSHEHVHAFIDMHDLGDALVRAGFADPVLDTERFTLTYRDVKALLLDLKATGSRNGLPGRALGMVSRAKFAKLIAAYESIRQDGVLPATYEVVYGQAWQSNRPRKTDDGTETRIPVAALRGRRR